MIQKNFFLRMCCVFLSLFLLLPFLSFSSLAKEIVPPSVEEASSAYLYHLESGLLVSSKNENMPVGAGSAVKVMSGLLFCEILGANLDESVYISKELHDLIPASPGRNLDIKEGDFVSVEQLLYAAICGSYNDAFYILAGVCAGTTEGFLQKMNERAQSLGLTNTIFEDVTGVIDGSRTTAADMANLAKFAYQNALYMTVCGTVSFSFSSTALSKTVYNRNALVCQYETQKYYNRLCVGMSAGSTSRDGNSVVTVAKKDGQTYICVVLGGKEIDGNEYGYRIANRLIDWVFSTYVYMEVLSPNTIICTMNVAVSDTVSTVDIIVKDSLSAYLPKGLEIGEDILYSIRLNETELEAPVEKDQFVGYVAILYEGRVLGTAPLYTAGEASRSSIGSGLGAIRKWLESRAVIAGIVFFVLGVITYLIVEYILYRRRHNRWDRYFSEKVELPDYMRTPPRPKHDKK